MVDVNKILMLVLLAVSVIASLMFVIWHNNKKPLFSLMFKLGASFGFVAIGAVALHFVDNSLAGTFALLGLVASLVGDGVLALLEFDMPDKRQNIIRCGMVSFCVAQACYFVAMILLCNGYLFWVSILGATAISLAIVFGEKILKLNYGKTKIFVGVYSLFLALSLLQSLFLAIFLGFNLMSILVFVGMILFFASDLVLSFIYFSDKKSETLYYPNYALYFVAQNILAFAIFLLVY